MNFRPLRAVLPRLARQGAKALAWTAFALAAGVGALDASGRLANTSAGLAWDGLRQEILGERSPVESEQLALLDDVASATGLAPLRWVSVGVADRLSRPGGPLAQFNPVAWRVEISPKAAALPLAQRREVLLHETGHAVAFASAIFGPAPSTGSPQADGIVQGSLLARQMFHEAFADAFAVAWALRENRRDPRALEALGAAVAKPQARPWASHQTSQALRALQLDLDGVLQAPAPLLPQKLQSIASVGAARAIAHLGAEREAACSMGARGLALFALDLGYDTVRLPWEMAKTEPVSPSDPMREGLLALEALRVDAAPEDPWLAALSRARPFVERALAEGSSAAAASAIARNGLALAYADALPEELDAAARAAALAAAGRSGWRGAFAQGALALTDLAFPTPTYGCAARFARR